MLTGAVRRLNGEGGDPVVQLQTNFGGGKTHSMLALYHLFSGTQPSDLPGVDAVLKETGRTAVPSARRAVLVGTKISPGTPTVKDDGTRVHTLWGELAWQLGGRDAYTRIEADDRQATNPGDALREIFTEHGPCLILIDEWVSYARQLHDESDLPAGNFDTQFTFAQTLTESAKAVDNCLVVISLPASDSGASPHAQADDIEVGGQKGREALDRLRNVTGRIEASFRPASAEEGFEIVRRRLFEPFSDPGQFKDRDTVARAFADLYRREHPDFPPECRNADYEKRLKAAYPIHPEVFDRLYTDWSTLVRFQRTRGVLRLMAAVIHNLWMKDDRNPLILPANLSIDDPHVLSELTRYLPDNWTPVIEKDVDGPGALPHQIDQNVSNLGKYSACRRVARTVYLGSAPTAGTSQRGIEDRRIKLGCMVPGESPAIFGDALRRLAATATYLYQDGARYWYDTRPTVTKLADDRAEQLRRNADRVTQLTHTRLRDALNDTGDFARVHAVPHAEHEVGDERETRLVVLGIEHPHQREGESPAKDAASKILESRGKGPRLYRNTLVFLVADQSRLQDLDEAVRREIAWKSILDERDPLELSRHQIKQAETQLANARETVKARLPETYQWLLTAGPKEPIIGAGLGGEPPDRPGRPRSPRRTPAQIRRPPSDEARGIRARHDARPDTALARQPREGEPAHRRLRAVRLPAASPRTPSTARRRQGRRQPPTVAGRDVRVRGSTRRKQRRVPGAPGRKRQGRADGRLPREAGHRRRPDGHTRQGHRRTGNAQLKPETDNLKPATLEQETVATRQRTIPRRHHQDPNGSMEASIWIPHGPHETRVKSPTRSSATSRQSQTPR